MRASDHPGADGRCRRGRAMRGGNRRRRARLAALRLLSPDQVRTRSLRSAPAPADRSTSISSATRCRLASTTVHGRRCCGLIMRNLASGRAMAARCACPSAMQMCGVVEETQPEVVSFHFGLPDPALLDRVKASGATIIGNATSVEEARRLEAARCRRDHRPGLRGRRPHRPLPWRRSRRSDRIVRARSAGRRRGIGSRDCRGRHRRRSRDRRRLHARCERGSARHRISPRARSARSATHIASGCNEGAHAVHQPHDRRARARPSRTPDRRARTGARAKRRPIRSPAPRSRRSARPPKQQGKYGFGPMWAGQAAPLGQALPAAELTRKLAADALAILESPGVEARRMEIVAVPAFADNYLWLVHDDGERRNRSGRSR